MAWELRCRLYGIPTPGYSAFALIRAMRITSRIGARATNWVQGGVRTTLDALAPDLSAGLPRGNVFLWRGL